MTTSALQRLLRECAVLLTALAFVMFGAVTPRQHAEAFAILADGGFVVCHPGGTDGEPTKAPATHHCDQCAIGHVHGVAPAASADAGIERPWQALERLAGTTGLAGAARAALPFATGPPAA